MVLSPSRLLTLLAPTGTLAPMCGRITLSYKEAQELAQDMGIPVEQLPPEYQARFNIAPTSDHLIVTTDREEREVKVARWGLINHWARDAKSGYKQINARAETVEKSPAFRGAFKKHRCLVPVDGFYEWAGPKGDRQPYWFHRPDRKVFYFAGLFESWQPPGEPNRQLTFTIITTAANDYLARIHNRMPVILETEEAQDTWLYPGEEDTAKLKGLLQPADDGALVAWPVSQDANSVKNDEPWLLDEVVLDKPAY